MAAPRAAGVCRLVFAMVVFACESPPRVPLVPAPRAEPRAQATPIPFRELDYKYFRRAWATAGARWLERNGGVERSDTGTGWRLDPLWPNRDQTAMKAYAIPYATVAAAHAALVCEDRELRGELAGFFETYLDRFSRLAELREETGYDKSVLDDDADGGTRVLRWVDTVGERQRLRECEVCSAQFMYGPALLVRVVASSQPQDRSPAELRFVRKYLPLIVRDHLLRPDNDAFAPPVLSTTLQRLAGRREPYDDRDLLMLATTIEILHAAHLDPRLVSLDSQQREALETATHESMAELRAWARPSSIDGAPTISFFEGMYAERSEYSFAGYHRESFPTADDVAPIANVGWDSGHYHRLALLLWSAWQARRAIGPEAPTRGEVAAAATQFTRTIWNGDESQPNFSNFSTGHDGWFRVGRGRERFGYPPSPYCDSRDDDRPCDLRMSTLGWGLLHRVQPEIRQVYDSLIGLAFTQDAQLVLHRNRVATYLGEELTIRDETGAETYPTLLMFWLGLLADRLPGCRS